MENKNNYNTGSLFFIVNGVLYSECPTKEDLQ